MLPKYIFHPYWFFLITTSFALFAALMTAYLGKRKELKNLQLIVLIISLCLPSITAIIMVFTSNNDALINDFMKRLVLFKISYGYLIIILFFMPAIICLATWISTFFGYSKNQFNLSKEFGVMKGWSTLGLILPLLIAPFFEELGWRGYGVDSLRAYFNLFNTSAIFGLLWGIWHLPCFSIEGFYHNQICRQNKLYALNFFASVFCAAFLMNWVFFKTGRSIPALVLFHGSLNLSAMALQTVQLTKCIVTMLMALTTIAIVICDYQFFFLYS
jgi:membrane protease YdiL (CAAX protease family)